MNPPQSVVPRLHCLFFKKLPNNYPFSIAPMDTITMQNVRNALLHRLTLVFRGDQIAAECVLLNMISRMYVVYSILFIVAP